MIEYWCEVLCSSSMTHLSDFEFKATDFVMLKLLLKAFRTVYFLNRWMNLIDTLPAVRYMYYS